MTVTVYTAYGSPEDVRAYQDRSRLALNTAPNMLRFRVGKVVLNTDKPKTWWYGSWVAHHSASPFNSNIERSYCGRSTRAQQVCIAVGTALVIMNAALGLVLVHRTMHPACSDPGNVNCRQAPFQADGNHHPSLSIANGGTREALSVAPQGTWQAIEDIKNSSILMVTFTNGYYSSLMLNWAKHVQALGLPYVVAVFDDTAASICNDNGLRWIRADQQMTSGKFREDFAQFRMMGSMKPKLVLDLFEHGNFQAISLSDTDTAWLRNPQQLLDLHPAADMLISTDCLSNRAEQKKEINVYRCGHIPGTSVGCMALNTGAMVFRRTDGAVKVLEEWYSQLSNKTKELVVRDADGSATGLRLSDQMEMNLLLAVGSEPIEAIQEDPHVILLMNRSVRVFPIPMLLAASGHTYFYQHLQESSGVLPYVVHTTFQRHGTAAKAVRFREEGLWMMEPADYYTADRQYLTYTNNVREYIVQRDVDWWDSHGTIMAWHHKHMLAATYQLSVLQDMWAVAKALNRTLIMPEFLCYCDQDFYTTVLKDCRIEGSDFPLPFPCPVDVFINTDALEELWAQYDMPYRTKSFLGSTEVPLVVRQSHTRVILHEDREHYEAALQETLGEVAGVYLHETESQMKLSLGQAHQESRVLSFINPRPGLFGGFTYSKDAAAFDTFFESLTNGLGWCCTGGTWEKQWNEVYWPYQRPASIGSRRGAAEDLYLPDMVRPAFCDTNQLVGDAVEALQLPNHPCKYLT